MSTPSQKKRKRHYRFRVRCSICYGKIDSDHGKQHAKVSHPGLKNVKFEPVSSPGQPTLASLYKRTKLSDATTSAERLKDTYDEAVVDQSAYSGKRNLDEIINADELSTDVLTVTDSQNSHRNTTSLVQDEDEHEGLMPVDEYSDFPLPDNDARTSAVNLSLQEEPAFGFEDGSAEESESLMTDENPDLPDNEEEIGNSDQAEASIGNIDQVKTPLSDCPNQPIRKQYAPRRYGKKVRDFHGKWFKEHPWLSFQIVLSVGHVKNL